MLDSSAFVDQVQQSYQANRAPNISTGGKKPGPMSDAKIDAVAQDFEAFFVSMMTETMMSGIKTDGPFGGGQGEKVFRSVLVQEYGKEAASQGNFGIADAVRQQLLKMQEMQEK
jgi:peptidoglycan hydrolase FlgJ